MMGDKLGMKLLSALIGLFLWQAAWAQDPCAESGPSCRKLTAPEVQALKARFLALQAALPVPDPARYALADGLDVAYTMPFVAEAALPVPHTGLSWASGCFPEKQEVSFAYDRKAGGKGAGWEGRVEVTAWLKPHPHLLDTVDGKCLDVSDPDAVQVEKSALFLSWQAGEESVSLHVVFGPRTCREQETLQAAKPAAALAPVKSIEITITGPTAEVAVLKKKMNRAALEALLGPVVK
jgi:hypothetical protein